MVYVVLDSGIFIAQTFPERIPNIDKMTDFRIKCHLTGLDFGN